MAEEKEFKDYFKGLNLPATKNDMMGIAKSNDAPGGVIKKIKRLPKDKYLDMDDLMNDLAS